jgi:DNA-binding CsgD family transcriptional regulator
MSDLDLVPAARLRALAHIAQQAARRDAPERRAAGALDGLAALTACDALSLFAWDPVARDHALVRSWGYAEADFPARGVGSGGGPRGGGGEGGDLLADDGYQLARRNRWPLRLTDVRRRTPPLARVLELARFGEGMTACLFTADGRYTGVVNVNVERDEPFDDGLLAAVALAVPALAEIADATGSLQEAAGLLPAGMPAVVLRPDGSAVALPGRGSSPLLAPGGAVLAAAARRAPARPGTDAFLVAAPDGALTRVLAVRPADPSWSATGAGATGAGATGAGVTGAVAIGAGSADAGATGAGAPAGQALLVGAEPASVPLSRRELEVVTLLVDGATNPQIAERLVVSRHTVATHLAHILDRLGVATRGAAAARAVRDGLTLA